MKKITFSLIVWQLLCVLCPLRAGDGFRRVTTGEAFNMPAKDGHQGDRTVDGSLLFYDSGGADGNIRTGYTGSVCFVPGNPGEKIEITFEELDVSGDASVQIYCGEVKSSGWKSKPDGYVADLTGKLSGQTFLSDSEDGKLSVNSYCTYSGSGAGWKAVVRSVVPADMTYTGSSVAGYAQETIWPGKKQVPVIAVKIRTEGSSNAFAATGLNFSVEGTTRLADMENIKVYYTGPSFVFNADRLFGEISGDPVSGFTIAGDQKLGSGDNYFWLAADIAADAVPGNKLVASCPEVTIDETSYPCSPSVPGDDAPVIRNIVLMPVGPVSYRVGDDPIRFYDDGGQDGSISEGFEGQVTFFPVHAGKKVKIDFTAVSLRLNTSVQNDDVLKIYNGSSAVAPALHTIVDRNEPVAIKSTAEDGSLTVTLKSVASLPGEGFEALVKEFTPRPMSAGEITTQQYTKGTVAAGDKEQPILRLNIRTDNTEPALTADSFRFTSDGTTSLSDITRAALYYTSKNENFATGTKVGETELNGNAEFVITGHQVLTEGDNYFWLAYDLSTRAVTGQAVDAGCLSVRLSGKDMTVENGKPEGVRTIKNEYVSKQETVSKVIYGEWDFTGICTSSPDNRDQVVTFLPGPSGQVSELVFSEFELYFPYSAIPVFEIYSGTEMRRDKLLWEVTREDKTPQLNNPFRPLDGDAALTVRYNQNGTQSNSRYGWKATVRPYLPRLMTIREITVTQKNTDFVTGGSTGQEIIGCCVMTQGNLIPLSLDRVTVDLKKSRSLVGKVSLYYTGADSVFAATELVGSLSIERDTPDEIILIPAVETYLEEGQDWYWIAYDMKSGVAPEQPVDAALVSLTASGTVYPVTGGDPAGERLTKNVYLLRTAGSDTLTIRQYSYLFYDDGGRDGKYSSNTDLGTVVFRPEEAGKVIRAVFLGFKNSSRDYLEFYNGQSTEEAGLLAEYDGNLSDNLPKPLLSEAADGAITVRFNRQGYSVNDGWEIEVSAYTPLSLTVGGITAIKANKEQLLGGSRDQPMLRVAVSVEGDRGEMTVNRLAFDLSGVFDPKSLKETKIYYTGQSDVFAVGSQFGDTVRETDSPLIFTGETLISKPGIYYFWLACDLGSEAVVGDILQFTASSVTINGSETIIPVSETAEMTVKDGFHGTYIIGNGGDYRTIAQAVAMMEDGINGPVVFELEDGTYDEAVYLTEVKGASAENTVTFRSKSGNPENVVLTSTAYASPGYGEDENGLFTVYGCDYLTLESVTLTTGKPYPYLIDIKNASQHVTIRNCRLIRDVSSVKNWLIHTGFVNRPVPNTPNTYLTVENCLFQGGYTGIETGGAGVSDISTGGTIRGNIFTGQWSKAIYVKYASQVRIENNRIDNQSGTTSEFDAMDIVYGYEGTCIRNNRIMLNLPYAIGIKIRPVSGTGDNPVRIYNNEINMSGVTNNSSRGISLSLKCTSAEIVHNTIRLAGSTERGTGIQSAAAKGSTVIIRNNIVQNPAGGPVFWVNSSAWAPVTVFGHNIIYSSGASLCRDQATFDEWVTASGAVGSVEKEVLFISDGILDIKDGEGLNIGEPSGYVTEDICGNSRNPDAPTAGAYEFAAVTDAPLMRTGYPAITQITCDAAAFMVKTDQHAELYRLIRTENMQPTVDEVVAAGESGTIQVIKNAETEIRFTGLESQRTYYPFFVLKSMANEMLSEVIAGEPFTTAFPQTEVATFENVAATEGVFEDGTAQFTGFTVETVQDGIAGSAKAARLNGTGTIALTNTERGLPVNGFYLRSDAGTTVTVYRGTESTGSKTVPATGDDWIFCNLKDMGELTAVVLTAAGECLIDDFAGDPQPLQVDAEDQSIGAGETVTVPPVITGGVPPFAYGWKDWKNHTVSDAAVLEFQPESTRPYILTVTDAWATTVSDTVMIRVTGDAVAATFDDLALEDESYWDGHVNPDLTWTDFYSGSYAFSNYYNHSWNAWEGFGYSNETSTEYQWLTHQFRSAAGSGAQGSRNYGVAYPAGFSGETAITVLNHPEGDTLSGMYVTNSAWAYDAMVNGDDLSGNPFKKGDWFKVTATGMAEDRPVSTAEFYLADYRSEDANGHYILNTWEWFDLRPLGRVTRVVFTMDGTRKNMFGLLLPTYFCLDEINGELPVKSVRDESVRKGSTEIWPLGCWFGLDDAAAPVAYSLYSTPADTVAAVSLRDDQLTVEGIGKGQTGWIVKAVQKGRQAFVRVQLAVTDEVGLPDVQDYRLTVYPVPVRGVLHIDTSLDVVRAEVVTVYGVRVYAETVRAGHNILDVDALVPGSYILRLYTGDGHTISRSFIKAE